MNLTRILSIVLFAVSLGLAYYLYHNINSTIEEKEYIKVTEAQTIAKLEIIREAEKAFHEQHGRFTANWDSLINFIENGEVPITVRKEKITQLSYGEEKVEVKIDTIGMMSAKDKIFKKNFVLNASAEGIFSGFLVKEGDYIMKGGNVYKLKVGDKKAENYPSSDGGYISALAKLEEGQFITKGQNIATIWDYHLDPKVDIKTLNIVPGSGKQFDIFAGTVDKSGIKVGVIEVKDPAPINKERNEKNEAENRKPLGFGSREDVGTGGNWE